MCSLRNKEAPVSIGEVVHKRREIDSDTIKKRIQKLQSKHRRLKIIRGENETTSYASSSYPRQNK